MKRIAPLKKTICCFAAEKRQLPGGKGGGGEVAVVWGLVFI